MQCHLRCDCCNTKIVFSKTTVIKKKKKKKYSCLQFFVCLLSFILLSHLLTLHVPVGWKKSASFLSLHIYNIQSWRNHIFWWGLLSFKKISELLNFSFVKQSFKDIRTCAQSCVSMVTSWLFWFVIIKRTGLFLQFSLGGEN